MEILYSVAFIIIVSLLGFLVLIKKLRTNNNRFDFAVEYRKKFIEFANTYEPSNYNNELYNWLLINLDKIQVEAGIYGIINYRAPNEIVIHENYPMILNTIPKFRTGKIHKFDIGYVDDGLLRYLGVLEIKRENILKEMKNPFKWFLDGFQLLINILDYTRKAGQNAKTNLNLR